MAAAEKSGIQIPNPALCEGRNGFCFQVLSSLRAASRLWQDKYPGTVEVWLCDRGLASSMGINAGLSPQHWKTERRKSTEREWCRDEKCGDLRQLHQQEEELGQQQASKAQPLQISHPDLVEQLDLPVEGAIDVLHVEERIIPDLNEQVLGKVADVVLAEVPFAQNAAGDDCLGILVAALAEVLAQVLTVPQPLDII